MSEKLLTSQAVAEITGFHPRTVSEMGRRGDIPGAIIIGKHVRFNARSFNSFLQRGGRPALSGETSAIAIDGNIRSENI